MQINLDNFHAHRRIFYLASLISFLALVLSVCALLIDDWRPKLGIVLCIAVTVATSVWVTFKDTLPDVSSAALFIFLANCLTPDIDTAMFYWITDDPDGPQFDPPFMGFISAASFGAMFMGVLLYNYYFSTWSYRRILSFAIVALALTNIFDIIIVMRWNLAVGIPDKLLALGDSALSPVARRLFALPMLILAAKVCPAGAEATLFAMMMSLSNFGSAVSVYLGALLLLVLGIQGGDYRNLVWAITIKSCCRLLPLLMVPLLIPAGSPSDTKDDLGGSSSSAHSSTGVSRTSSSAPLTDTDISNAHRNARSCQVELSAPSSNNL